MGESVWLILEWLCATMSVMTTIFQSRRGAHGTINAFGVAGDLKRQASYDELGIPPL